MTATALGAVALAALLDLAVGEPPERVHPVVALGTVVDRVDRDWRWPALAGVAVAVVLPAGYGLVAATLVAGGTAVHGLLGAGLAGIVLFASVSLRSLLAAGRDVLDAAARDADDTASRARSLVGRDTTTLGPGALRSAAVESLGENLADGLVGPLVAFALGSLVSLPVAAGAAAWVKGVNTLDSMLGYRDNPMGWASARLDDLVAWLPARTSAVLLAIAAGRPITLLDAQRWAGVPASPNSGWPMATLAALLDVSLVKPGAYALNPGSGLPSRRQSASGVAIVRRAGLLAFALVGVVAWY